MINFSLIICLATLGKKESRPEFPNLTFKGMVTPDTPISQINEKKSNIKSEKYLTKANLLNHYP